MCVECDFRWLSLWAGQLHGTRAPARLIDQTRWPRRHVPAPCATYDVALHSAGPLPITFGSANALVCSCWIQPPAVAMATSSGLRLEVVRGRDDRRASKHVNLPDPSQVHPAHIESMSRGEVCKRRVTSNQGGLGSSLLGRSCSHLVHRASEDEAGAWRVLGVAERLADGTLLLPPDIFLAIEGGLRQREAHVGNAVVNIRHRGVEVGGVYVRYAIHVGKRVRIAEGGANRGALRASRNCAQDAPLEVGNHPARRSDLVPKPWRAGGGGRRGGRGGNRRGDDRGGDGRGIRLEVVGGLNDGGSPIGSNQPQAAHAHLGNVKVVVRRQTLEIRVALK
mmetsp:Transcript_26315/g.52834  ORF Transcript_26315/g.52834 Transcript_26315/m.52834 type:complete len:336 (+) Transcript_26315:117-1124(+)